MAAAWRAAAGAAARFALALPLMVTLLWLLSYGTRIWSDDRHWRLFPPDFGCDDSKVLGDPCTRSSLLWLLGPPAAAGLIAVAALALVGSGGGGEGEHGDDGSGSGSSGAKRRSSHVTVAGGGGGGRLRRWLARAASAQLPPVRFWAWWCGGLSGADAAAAALWLLVNGLWLGAILKR